MAMDEKLRQRLSKPFGPVLSSQKVVHRLSSDRPSLLIAVGDRTIYELLRADHVPDIAIFDLRCQRQAIDADMKEHILSAAMLGGGSVKVSNPAGAISPKLEKAVLAALKKKKGWICVEGEDDLAALVGMAYAPDSAVLIYGQPHAGAVWVGIHSKLRHEAQELLEKVKEK